jgi:hypothetical protein
MKPREKTNWAIVISVLLRGRIRISLWQRGPKIYAEHGLAVLAAAYIVALVVR